MRESIHVASALKSRIVKKTQRGARKNGGVGHGKAGDDLEQEAVGDIDAQRQEERRRTQGAVLAGMGSFITQVNSTVIHSVSKTPS